MDALQKEMLIEAGIDVDDALARFMNNEMLLARFMKNSPLIPKSIRFRKQ